MSIETEQSLSRAYELIEADRLDEARTILKPVLEVDKNNADAWWLYAHAVTDAETARLALSNVQRIDPDYPEVDTLLRTLETKSYSDTGDAFDDEPSFLPPLPSTLPGLDKVDKRVGDDDQFDEDQSSIPFWRRPAFLLLIGLILFLVIAAVVILRPPPETSITVDPTQDVGVVLAPTSETPFVVETPIESQITTQEVVAETPDESQVVTPEVNATEESIAAGQSDFAGLAASLSAFGVAESGIVASQTVLGNTIIVDVCTQPGSEMRETLVSVLNSAAAEASNYSSNYDAIAARMLDCATNTTLHTIGSTISDMTSYASGSVTQTEFEAQWQPIG